ncbi:MAG: DUF29 domain-containing protein [Methylococcales bacterium]
MINYEHDFYGWTQEQATLLKAGRLSDLDTVNILEEIEAMGRREKRELQSRLIVLLVHLLKYQYQSERRSRSWENTIKTQRLDFEDVLSENPSVKPKMDSIFSNAYRLARQHATDETGLPLSAFPASCPWTYEQVTDDCFYPG